MFEGQLVGVKDQGWCGASWVFSALSVAQNRLGHSGSAKGHCDTYTHTSTHLDTNTHAKTPPSDFKETLNHSHKCLLAAYRLVMESNGVYRVSFSAQDLLSCGSLGVNGCLGGHLDRAWHYLRMTGALPEVCYPYRSGFTRKLPTCAKNSGLGCQSRYKSGPAYRLPSKERYIQREIITNGPVQALMTVHPDFFLYKTGVYSYSELGSPHSAAHSVKLLGWGEERVNGKTVKYWVNVNSWGKYWGEAGYFRLLRGSNECGIESHVFTAKPQCESLYHGLEMEC
ncbi:uncharacterized peptidase C1-like protein F26E4.3 [Penaeus monodon]|uniref:uncharacterized peptidase C1-like protein F26E4.3 n=1 Tax=Penaeus monodon TaxID=6687 RepID=UPI0018A6EC16|nr:uncharacterized peptidase C1-like protein F26E4.3 [Penaeus monodon]